MNFKYVIRLSWKREVKKNEIIGLGVFVFFINFFLFYKNWKGIVIIYWKKIEIRSW